MLKKTPTFEFAIIASGLDPEADDFFDRFYDAGCDDATIAFQKGHIIADFAREAESLADAIVSAMQAVKKAGAKVDRVEPESGDRVHFLVDRLGADLGGERGPGAPGEHDGRHQRAELAEHRNPDAVHDEDHCAELPGDEPDLEGDDDAVNPLSKLTLR